MKDSGAQESYFKKKALHERQREKRMMIFNETLRGERTFGVITINGNDKIIGDYANNVGKYSNASGIYACMGEEWTGELSTFGQLNWPGQIEAWLEGLREDVDIFDMFS